MGGVAEDGGAAKHPGVDRLAVGRGPALPALGQFDELTRLRTDALKVALNLRLRTIGNTPLFRISAVKGYDHVVLLTTAQGVVHQVALRACPEARRVPLEVIREVVLIDDCTVYNMPGNARGIVYILGAHYRLSAVGANERLAGPTVSVLVNHCDGLSRFILLDLFYAGVCKEGHLPAFLNPFQ